MTMPTKQQIDEMVEAMPRHPADHGAILIGGNESNFGRFITPDEMCRWLFLAAGLNADGSEKAVTVPVLMVVNPEYPGDKHFWCPRNVPQFPASYIITPGTFTPDGAS